MCTRSVFRVFQSRSWALMAVTVAALAVPRAATATPTTTLVPPPLVGDGAVAYGPGYDYPPRVGREWIDPPLTFGFGLDPFYFGDGFGYGGFFGRGRFRGGRDFAFSGGRGFGRGFRGGGFGGGGFHGGGGFGGGGFHGGGGFGGGGFGGGGFHGGGGHR
jgi:hypothetical protein